MAGFGGAVRLSGESEYRRALALITQNLKELSSEMKTVSSEYDKNDTSTEAVASRSQVLTQILEQQREKLATLQSQYEQLSPKVQEQAEKHKALIEEYENEKKKLETIGETLGETSQEYKDQESKVAGLAEEVKKSTVANDANEKSLSNLKIQMNNTQTEINNTTKEMDALGKEAKDSGKEAEEGSKGYTVLKNVIANLATKAIESAINGLKQLGSAFIEVGQQAVGSYKEFEQLEGGAKKLFGDDVAQTVMENAQNAFATAGMTANEYLSTVTNFSASLISGLDGDTVKASQIADQAIRDMADNANTFGTSIESIQNAYQGFAKGNFTMLDNLKLGYGGTKTEMLRLVKDAGVVDQSVKSLDDVSFDQMIEAIHIVQENLNITGTTAKEASTTIEGSTKAMQSAWQNMLTGMADENANFEELANNFIGTLIDENGGGVIGTLVPRVTQVITGMSNAIQTLLPQLIQTVVPIIQSNLPIIMDAVNTAIQTILGVLPEILPVITGLIPQIVSSLIGLLPELTNAGIQLLLALISGVSDTIPQLIGMMPVIIRDMVETLMNNLPEIITTGIDLLLGLITGLSDAIPELIDYLPEIIQTIITVLMENLPKIIEAGMKIIPALINGVFKTLSSLGSSIRKINGIIKDTLKELPSVMLQVGVNIVKGIWSGITNSLSWIKSMIRGWVGNVTSFIKRLFGIASPSKLFRDEIGENLALGIGEGFSSEMKDVSQEMADAIPTDFDISPTVTGARYTNSNSEMDMVASFKEALAQMEIILDDEVAGKFVEKTVTNAIYA